MATQTIFEDYVPKRCQWLEALNGDDCNSISMQLLQMTSHAATFRVIDEARRLAPSDPRGGVQLNGMIHEFINRGFVDSQFAAVRRLVDGGKYTAKKSVYSLIGLLKEIKDNQSLFTRSNMLHAESLEYNYAALTHDRHLAGKRSQIRHEEIDELVRVGELNRGPDDVIPIRVFDNLLDRVSSSCKRIEEYATKFIAHAATPFSRNTVPNLESPINLKQFSDAHQSLCEAAAVLAIKILGVSFSSPIATPTFDQFEYIDRPFVATKDVEKLRQVWEENENEVRKWTLGGTVLEADSRDELPPEWSLEEELRKAFEKLPPEAFSDPERKPQCDGRPFEKRAAELLDFARDSLKQSTNWLDLHNAIYGHDGRFLRLFSTQIEQERFRQSQEAKEIHAFVESLPEKQ